MKNEFSVPLYPLTGALLPYESMWIQATAEPYLSLLKSCADRDELFGVVYFDDTGLRDVGCLARVESYETTDSGLACQIRGYQRFHVDALISLEEGRRVVASGGREIVFESDEPASPCTFIGCTAIEDTPQEARADIRADLLTHLKAHLQEEPALYEEVAALEHEPSFSFIVAGLLLDSHSDAGNAMRLDLLNKQSETKRLRMLKNLFQEACPAG